MEKSDILHLLARPVSFHAVLARAGGGATAGLFLSQLLYWTGKGHDPDGWIKKSWQEWDEETCLTQDEQRGARKKLVKIGILEEERKGGVDPTLWYRINFERLNEIIKQNQSDGNIPSGSGNIPSGSGNIPPPDGKNPICYTETTAQTTAETTTTTTSKNGGSGGDGLQDLMIQQCLEKYLPSLSLPASWGHDLRQQLLDELAGAIDAGLVKATPARFLSGLVKRAKAGEFHPDLAINVAAGRARRAANAAAVAAAHANAAPPKVQLSAKRSLPPCGSAMAMLIGAGVNLTRSQGLK